jgi:hypothetical protein
MHTAFFQAGSEVVEYDQPADRICIVVSGRFVTALNLCQPYPVEQFFTKTYLNQAFLL